MYSSEFVELCNNLLHYSSTPHLWGSHKGHSSVGRVPDYIYIGIHKEEIISQYVNWNKHPVPVPPSSRPIHYELQHSCVTSCLKSWWESCLYSCNYEGPPIKIHFSIDLSNWYSYNHVIMYTCDCQFHLNHANWHLCSFWHSTALIVSKSFLTKQNAKEETVKIME